MAETAPIVVCTREPAAEAAAMAAGALRAVTGHAPRLAVSGGSALRALGLLRAQLSDGHWSRVRLTWVDERCVPVDSGESNRGRALVEGLLEPSEPPGYELPLYLDRETPEQACRRVETALLPWFGNELDVLLFGMGEDGHIASLFPGRRELEERRLVVSISDSPKPPPRRITLTLPLLATAGEAVLLAAGEGKRNALERLLRREPALPASALARLTVVTDLEL